MKSLDTWYNQLMLNISNELVTMLWFSHMLKIYPIRTVSDEFQIQSPSCSWMRDDVTVKSTFWIENHSIIWSCQTLMWFRISVWLKTSLVMSQWPLTTYSSCSWEWDGRTDNHGCRCRWPTLREVSLFTSSSCNPIIPTGDNWSRGWWELFVVHDVMSISCHWLT